VGDVFFFFCSFFVSPAKHQTAALLCSSTRPVSSLMSQPEDKVDYKDPKACAALKEAHDECFHRWMREKFIPGIATQDDCKPEWDAYQVCIQVRLLLYLHPLSCLHFVLTYIVLLFTLCRRSSRPLTSPICCEKTALSSLSVSTQSSMMKLQSEPSS